MQLNHAKTIAVDICYRLQPFCSRINIAGSIRRKKPEVKDIEIVCCPVMVPVSNDTLFGSETQAYKIHPEFISTVNSIGKIEKGTPTGRYVKIVLADGINLDLFIPEYEDFYRQYAIRTGNADYAFKVIAHGWRKKGWCGSDLGLRLEQDCIETKQPDGKSKWTCVRNKDNKPPHWQSEQEFFNWLGVTYIEPQKRNL